MTCNYTPPLVEQLHGPDPTAGSDCAIACAKMAIRFATCGSLDPSLDGIREQAGLDEPNPPPDDFSTTMAEYKKALNAFDDEAQRAGYGGIGAEIHERGQWENDGQGLAPTIRQEARWVTTFLSYAVVNDRIPAKSGDKNFRGSHAVGIYGFKSADETGDEAMCRVFDPLADGRSSGVPEGAQWWPMGVVRDACDAYAGGGSGNATWCTTPRSKPVDEPPPDPECDAAYAVVAEAKVTLRGLLAALGDLYVDQRRDDDEPEYLVRPGVK